MDFFKVKKFRKAHKPKPASAGENNSICQPEDPINENGDVLAKSVNVDDSNIDAEDDDDDFITNEVKRRLKELRRNSSMELIPEEESSLEEEDEEGEGVEVASKQWRVVEAEGRQFWSGFDAIYDIYCDRMLFFDRVIAQQLPELGFYVPSPSPRISRAPSTPSPRSMSKKLTSPFRCLSLNGVEEHEDEIEQLQQPTSDPYQDLEAAYVAQLCLTWEAIHCQYTQMSQKIYFQPENRTAYNHAAQQLQQFQVLLQRFIENEPFEKGARPEIYARSKKLMPKLLQAPKIQGSNMPNLEEDDSQLFVLAPDLLKIIECSILSFRQFLKTEKKKHAVARNFFGSQNQMAGPLQQVHSSLEKKVLKLKELRKRKKNWKDKTWPTTETEVQLLLALIDAKLVSKVMRLVSINNDQLLWCEQKMKKLDFSGGKLRRDPSPILFPC
ncbi:hypothetical protein Leryth_011363 [Lithospermum erythrorhizon]|uniref:Ribosomal protein L34Ae n=1 Tax=Lithospermum erythrorhizon TaxID=34254 RepID=A0AAV3PTM1_LITER|nr:hypothetical protein Leryth_011363 [Lithospermum erythrorhizon]